MSRSLYLETRLLPTIEEGEKVRIEAGAVRYIFTACEVVDPDFQRLYLEEVEVRIEAGGARYIFTACEVIDPDFQRLYLEEIECLPTKNAESE